MPLRVCFDVDGVLADNSDPALPYAERKPYAHALEMVRRIKNEGHTIIIQTARGMGRYDGNQQKAHKAGYQELVDWLNENDVPYDEVYFGKSSASFYVDDRAFHLRSEEGVLPWEKFLVELAYKDRMK